MFPPKRKLISLLFLSFIFFLVFFFSSREAAYMLRSFVSDVSKIPLAIVTGVSHEVRALVFFHRSYWDNIKLTRQNEESRSQRLYTEQILAENERLAKLLELKTNASYQTQATRVIGKDFNTFRSYLILDKGKANGIKKYAPVVTSLGLVGKVLEAGRFSAKVILINDPDLSVPAVIVRTQEQGLVSGTLDGLCKLRFLDTDSDIREGDEVVTSGLNMTYPKGILIGKVKLVGVESSGLGKFAIVTPAVKISSLSEALVVTL